jgi:hypothetical protein
VTRGVVDAIVELIFGRCKGSTPNDATRHDNGIERLQHNVRDQPAAHAATDSCQLALAAAATRSTAVSFEFSDW